MDLNDGTFYLERSIQQMRQHNLTKHFFRLSLIPIYVATESANAHQNEHEKILYIFCIYIYIHI